MKTTCTCANCQCDLTGRVRAFRVPTKEITNWPKDVPRPVAVLLCASCYEIVIYANAPEGVRPKGLKGAGATGG
jgi:ribosomal protein L34E